MTAWCGFEVRDMLEQWLEENGLTAICWEQLQARGEDADAAARARLDDLNTSLAQNVLDALQDEHDETHDVWDVIDDGFAVLRTRELFQLAGVLPGKPSDWSRFCALDRLTRDDAAEQADRDDAQEELDLLCERLHVTVNMTDWDSCPVVRAILATGAVVA